MNPRIKNLAEQAGLDIEVDEDEDASYVFNETLEYIEESYGIDLKKFAELIVKECDRYVAEQYDESEPWMQPGDLLKHFGVRE